tara:strand:+ start:2178 stop:2411 length:234 start_codon:yes stop_codon:yes gene_type:complete
MGDRNAIYEAAGLTPTEVLFMTRCMTSTGPELYGSHAYEKLFEYFTFTTCEMPYGIAKARTGDPDLWIIKRLEACKD